MVEWTVAITHSNMQATAHKRLLAQGVECYFPMFCELVVSGKQKIYRQRYLFGSYFFVVIAEHWRAITATQGVARLLMIGDALSGVKQSVIDELRAREDARGFVRINNEKIQNRFFVGQQVRVTYGPMNGLGAIVAGMSGAERVRVLLTMLGRQTPATMHQDQLAAA